MDLQRKQLVNALNQIKTSCPSKSALPILQMVRLESVDGLLILTTTNLEVMQEISIGCRGDFPAVCVGLTDLLTKVKSGDDLVTIEAVPFEGKDLIKEVTVSNGGITSTLLPLPAEEFPNRAAPKPEHDLTLVSIPRFSEAVSQVIKAASSDEARPVLTGIHGTVRDHQAHFEAADGFRLAQVAVEAECDQEYVEFLFGGPSLSKIKLPAETARVWVNRTLGKVRIEFEHSRLILTSQLIDGTYPHLEAVFPTIHADTPTAVINAQVVRQALKVILDNKVSPCHVQMNGKLELWGKDKNENPVKVSAPCSTTNLIHEWGVQPVFLKDALDTYSNQVTLYMRNQTTPVLLQGAVDEPVWLIMPMFLDN